MGLKENKAYLLNLPPALVILCGFGDLGNLAPKHGWCPFDWGQEGAWSLDKVETQWRRGNRKEQED